MDNCKTDEKQIGNQLEWPSDMKAEVINEAVKEHKNIVDEVVKEKKETYELIKTEIKNRIINIPPGDVQYTKAWLDAYSKCQEDILRLLERLEAFDVESYKAKA